MVYLYIFSRYRISFLTQPFKDVKYYCHVGDKIESNSYIFPNRLTSDTNRQTKFVYKLMCYRPSCTRHIFL